MARWVLGRDNAARTGGDTCPEPQAVSPRRAAGRSPRGLAPARRRPGRGACGPNGVRGTASLPPPRQLSCQPAHEVLPGEGDEDRGGGSCCAAPASSNIDPQPDLRQLRGCDAKKRGICGSIWAAKRAAVARKGGVGDEVWGRGSSRRRRTTIPAPVRWCDTHWQCAHLHRTCVLCKCGGRAAPVQVCPELVRGGRPPHGVFPGKCPLEGSA